MQCVHGKQALSPPSLSLPLSLPLVIIIIIIIIVLPLVNNNEMGDHKPFINVSLSDHMEYFSLIPLIRCLRLSLRSISGQCLV